MPLPNRTNTHRRVSLSAAAVIATLAVAMAEASVAAPMGASVQRPTPPGASSGPGIQFPGFVRDRGRYTPLVVPGAVTQTFPRVSTTAARSSATTMTPGRRARLPAAEGRQLQQN